MIGTLVKFPISEMSRMTIKGNIWYIHDFLKAVGNNIRVLFLIFDWLYWSSKAAVIACFWYFNNNDIFSVITPLNFDNDNVSLIQIFRLHTEFCLPYFFFSASRSKVNSYIKFFIENQLPVKNNPIHVSVTVLTSKSRRVKFASELCYSRFQRLHDNKKC